MSIERTKRKFLERFVRKLPIEQLEVLFNFKMENIELEGQYVEGSKFSCELNTKPQNISIDDRELKHCCNVLIKKSHS